MKIDKLLVLNLALGSGGVCASTEWEETLDAPVWPDMTPECLDAEATPACSSKTGKSVSFFSGPWQLDQKFISTVVGKSGAYVYCESGDPVEANDALFTLHARFPGRKTVYLPRKADVVDVFNHRLVARDTDVFSFDADLHDTALFYYGPDAEELLLKLR